METRDTAPEGATDPWATVQAFDLHGYGGYPFRQEDRPDGLYVLRTDVDRARAAVETAHRQEIARLTQERDDFLRGRITKAYLLSRAEKAEAERDALAAQVATLREALEQIAAYDELTGREYFERYGRTVYERPQSTIARAALAATEGGTK